MNVHKKSNLATEQISDANFQSKLNPSNFDIFQYQIWNTGGEIINDAPPPQKKMWNNYGAF